MLTMKVECRNCYGLGKLHSDGRNGDPMDNGVDCQQCEGTGVVKANEGELNHE